MSRDLGLEWRKSRRSHDCSACVEFAKMGTSVGMRDSLDPDGPVLRFSIDSWRSFVHGVKLGEFEVQDSSS